MGSTPQLAPSQQVIKDRLKNGQCIHCGIQTHTVRKKMLRKDEKIPLNIAGRVEHGRCMQASCLQAGNNVAVAGGADNNNKPGRVSAHGVGMAASVGGAVMAGLGIPGGELLSGVGQAVTDSSCSSSSVPSYSAFGGGMAGGSSQQHIAQLLAQSRQREQQAWEQLKQIQAQSQQQSQQVMEQLMQQQQQQQQIQPPYMQSQSPYMQQLQAQQQSLQYIAQSLAQSQQQSQQAMEQLMNSTQYK